MPSPQPARRFFFLLLAAATVLFALVVRPLASALFLAAVLAGVLWPAHLWLAAKLGRRPRRVALTSQAASKRGEHGDGARGGKGKGERRGLSAALMVAGVLFLLLVPVVAFSTFAFKEASDGARFVSQTVRSDGVTGLVDRLPPPLARLAHRGLARLSGGDEGNLSASVQKQVGAQGGRAAAAVGATLSATGAFVFQAVMMLIALYFLLLQGDELVSWIDDLSPLRRGQTRELLAEFKKVSYAVILSTVITAAVQAAAALVGYFIGRVPHPLFFAGVTFFAAFIPAVGAGAICLVAAGLLFATGHTYGAVFLAAWGLVVVGLVDNLVKPLLIKGGMEMNGAVVFFALIGGLSAFGGVGLLLGPLVVTLFLALLRMYQRDFNPDHALTAG
ncbi:MAG: AI-2E family transporter [Myxococcales bacterium]